MRLGERDKMTANDFRNILSLVDDQRTGKCKVDPASLVCVDGACFDKLVTSVISVEVPACTMQAVMGKVCFPEPVTTV